MLSRVHFRPRAMPASMPYTKQNPFRLSPAGRTCAASAMTFIRRNRPLWPLKRLSPSRNCMASKSACVGNRPIFGALHGWLVHTLEKISQKSALAGAIRSAWTRWEAITRDCDHGALEIDNNAAERALRTVALGQKND